ncbi:UNVERIFIED_CONTAM: hypothetical protein Sradi_5485500 [Sesamum radiatum]|uniref:Uncharacterized protein n=1 Tax=Sesamum radiatum TaxID=300843 RepID=A0AAW2LD04_SESRA
MLFCLKQLPAPSTNNDYSSPVSQGSSVENTPRRGAQLSATINLSEEYALAVQTHSYGEIQRTFDQDSSFDQTVDSENVDFTEEPQLLEQVLRPSREYVQETLSLIRHNPLTYLVATYFEHSEQTSRLCFLLFQSVRRAQLIYSPIHNLLDDLPMEFDSDSYSLSHSLCNSAHNIFLHFDRLENPFLPPDSENFNNVRQCFSDLRDQLNRHVRKPRSRTHPVRYCSTGCALCLIAAAVGVAMSAVAIASHALVALVGSPICIAMLPSIATRKETARLPQLDAAAINAYVLHKELDTTDRLVRHLHTDVENDKLLVRLGLERGMDEYLIQEILKQLWRNRPGFVQRLVNLEEHLIVCFAAINRTRSQLVHEIHLHQNSGSFSPG